MDLGSLMVAFNLASCWLFVMTSLRIPLTRSLTLSSLPREPPRLSAEGNRTLLLLLLLLLLLALEKRGTTSGWDWAVSLESLETAWSGPGVGSY